MCSFIFSKLFVLLVLSHWGPSRFQFFLSLLINCNGFLNIVKVLEFFRVMGSEESSQSSRKNCSCS